MGILVAFAKTIFGKLSMCALVGGLVGVATGFLLSLFQLQNPGLVLTASQAVAMGLELGLLGWLFALLVVGVWLHYGLKNIAMQTLINALVTAILAVFLNNLMQMPAIGVIVGLLVGIFVGSLLCELCRRYDRSARTIHHG